MNILLVDDSTAILTLLERLVKVIPGIHIFKAHNAEEALSLLKEQKIDVITLDIEMPGKNGLETLPYIQKLSDAAILMCSNLTEQGASATFLALEKGAFDYIAKTKITTSYQDILKERILLAYDWVQKKRLGVQESQKDLLPISKLPHLSHLKLLVIGASTGGPAALQLLLERTPVLPLPLVLVQHMPKAFVKPLVERLQSCTSWKVQVAEHGQNLHPGTVYVAPGDLHLAVRRQMTRIFVEMQEEPLQTLHKPSVNVLFQTAAEVLGKDALGVILTGMGTDGKEGSMTLRHRGGHLLAESASSCAVYGMPRAVIEARLANWQYPLQEIPDALSKLVLGKMSR